MATFFFLLRSSASVWLMMRRICVYAPQTTAADQKQVNRCATNRTKRLSDVTVNILWQLPHAYDVRMCVCVARIRVRSARLFGTFKWFAVLWISLNGNRWKAIIGFDSFGWRWLGNAMENTIKSIEFIEMPLLFHFVGVAHQLQRSFSNAVLVWVWTRTECNLIKCESFYHVFLGRWQAQPNWLCSFLMGFMDNLWWAVEIWNLHRIWYLWVELSMIV